MSFRRRPESILSSYNAHSRINHLRMDPGRLRDDTEGTITFRPTYPSCPRPQNSMALSPHSRHSRGADEASGGETGSRGRPAPVCMLTTGRSGDGERAQGTRPAIGPNPRMSGWPLDACAGKTGSCEAAFASSNYQSGGASPRGESRFPPCPRRCQRRAARWPAQPPPKGKSEPALRHVCCIPAGCS
jgi:hypothetical protein